MVSCFGWGNCFCGWEFDINWSERWSKILCEIMWCCWLFLGGRIDWMVFVNDGLYWYFCKCCGN